jgi:hypothetical protein
MGDGSDFPKTVPSMKEVKEIEEAADKVKK